MLFRWFVGLAIEDAVWNHSVFSKNRDRLIEHEDITELFNAAAADVKAALEALDSVGTVLVNATSASATTTMYSVSFVPWMGASQVHITHSHVAPSLKSPFLTNVFGWVHRGTWRTTAACR